MKKDMRWLQLFAEEGTDAAATAPQNAEAATPPEAQSTEKTAQEQSRGASRYAAWVRQAEEARAIYPALDLEREAQDPTFRKLLLSGVDVGTAYLARHKDEILPMAMQYAAREVEKKLMSKVMAGGIPAENGTAPGGAALVQTSVSAMTREQRREIIRRVARGEKVKL